APGKDGFKLSFTAAPIPPITQVPLPFTCHVTIEGSIAYLECHNAVPNPNPPKHKLTVKIDCAGGPAHVTGSPDGQVTASCRGKVSAFDKGSARLRKSSVPLAKTARIRRRSRS